MHDAASSVDGSHADPGDSVGGRKCGIGPLISGSGSANFASENRPVRGTYCVQVHVTMVRP